MTDLVELVFQFVTLNGTLIAVGLTATAAVVVLCGDRRVLLLSMALQYLLAWLLLSQALPWRVAAAKLAGSLCSCIILLVTAWRVGWRPQYLTGESYLRSRRVGADSSEFGRFGSIHNRLSVIRSPLRVFTLIIVCLLALHIYSSYGEPFAQTWVPDAPEGLMLATMQLVCLGLLVLGIGEGPFRSGIGLLTFLTGFGLFYSLLESALVVMVMLVAMELVVAISTSYLSILRVDVDPRSTTSSS